MSIWVKCMYVYGVWMCVKEFWSFHALYGAANALYWKCLKRQNSTYLTLLKHQNTKTSLYKLSKNHWVITLLENFGSVRRKLQSIVFLDHPVFSFNLTFIVPELKRNVIWVLSTSLCYISLFSSSKLVLSNAVLLVLSIIP